MIDEKDELLLVQFQHCYIESIHIIQQPIRLRRARTILFSGEGLWFSYRLENSFRPLEFFFATDAYGQNINNKNY